MKAYRYALATTLKAQLMILSFGKVFGCLPCIDVWNQVDGYTAIT
jgi:hypothetical protein